MKNWPTSKYCKTLGYLWKVPKIDFGANRSEFFRFLFLEKFFDKKCFIFILRPWAVGNPLENRCFDGGAEVSLSRYLGAEFFCQNFFWDSSWPNKTFYRSFLQIKNYFEKYSTFSKIFFSREFRFSELRGSAAGGGRRPKSKINAVGVSPVLWEVGGAQKRCLGSPGRKFGVFGPWLLASPSARLNLSEISAELGGDQNEGRGAFT